MIREKQAAMSFRGLALAKVCSLRVPRYHHDLIRILLVIWSQIRRDDVGMRSGIELRLGQCK